MKHEYAWHDEWRGQAFSALGRAVWDETDRVQAHFALERGLSVLSVEPYGMKLEELEKN